jgi:hypothetical protein
MKKLGSHSSTIKVLALSDINKFSMNVVVNFIVVMTFKGDTIAKIGLLWFLPIKVFQIPNHFQGLHDKNENSRTLQKVYDCNQN